MSLVSLLADALFMTGIRLGRSKEWYQFSDELVTKIVSLHGGDDPEVITIEDDKSER